MNKWFHGYIDVRYISPKPFGLSFYHIKLSHNLIADNINVFHIGPKFRKQYARNIFALETPIIFQANTHC